MRLVSAFLFLALTGSAVLAEEPRPADPKPEVTKKKVPYRVVKMLPETGQVLLFDRNHGSHVVAEVGQTLDGYTVDEIDEDEVTLLAETGGSVILAAPMPPRQARRAAKAKAAPVDPYADEAAATTDPAATDPAGDGADAPRAKANAKAAPVDPYAEPEAPTAPGEGGVRVASAADPSTATSGTSASTASSSPAATSESGVRTSTASPAPAATSESSPSAPPPAPIVDAGPSELSDPYGDPGIAAFADAVGATPPAAEPGKVAKPAKAKAPATTAPAGSVIVARTELDAALGDFTRTAGTFRATFTPDGLRFDAVAEGSLLAKVGLRKGDIVTYVDGKPLRSLDDAASLYARAGSMRGTTIQVARDGKNVTLRVAIQS